MVILDLSALQDLSGHVPIWEFVDGEYRFVLFSGNKVQVFKGESLTPSYEINERGCSCPAAQHGRSCKHLRFSWVG